MFAKVALIQSDIRWKSVDYNLQTIEQMIAATPQSDLYVLPETFATGFGTEPSEAAKAEQQIVEMMSRVAKKSNCAVCGSLIVERDGRYRNQFYVRYTRERRTLRQTTSVFDRRRGRNV